ncbi:MAG: carbohydrate ABC transporter substrate-binding protein, partial [Tabrizicola sp.]|nr:carbohydrate ABC transporter substrate-binding protein [Tabrizicola sp.]
MKARFLAGSAALALMAGGAAAQDLKFPVGEGAFNWDSYKAYDEATNLEGQTLKIFGPWRGEDQVLVESMLAYFTAASGVTVEYSSSENYEQQIVIDTEAGSPPDIAILPQPGLIADLVKKGFVTPLGEDTQVWLADNYAAGDSWVGLGSYAGPDGATALYAFPYKIDVKSLVWYSPDNFADAGYAVPQTMEELKALTDQIVADGGTPWCIGLGSGGATGWPATDWVEDMMLRTQSADVYDKWVKHEIGFNDPAVVAAIDEFGAFARNDAYVAGGAAAVATTDFRDSPK